MPGFDRRAETLPAQPQRRRDRSTQGSPAPTKRRSGSLLEHPCPFSYRDAVNYASDSPLSTRAVRVGTVQIGGTAPIVVQSMCATKTRDIDATVAQCEQLRRAGAGVVRIAVDNEKEVEALAEIRRQTTATLAVDLQENYRLAAKVGPLVDKIRYNPGHLHHVERHRTIRDKVGWLVDMARDTDCAIRIGVNC